MTGPKTGQLIEFRPPASAAPEAHAAAGTVEILAERYHRASRTGKVYLVRNVDSGIQTIALPDELVQ